MFFNPQKKFVNPVENEIKILDKLNHENIVRACEIIDKIDHNYTYIILEYMKKGSITKIMQKKKVLNMFMIWNYFRNLINGLEYLHEKVNIIHFDIKPDNLLVNEFNNLKITDFGISYQFNDNDLVKSINLGSPFYMSPEMTHTDAKYFGKPCDIWSSGITLFYIVFKKLPFYVMENHEIKKLFQKIRQDEYYLNLYSVVFPDTREIDGNLKDLINKMLNKNPNERITLKEIKVINKVI